MESKDDNNAEARTQEGSPELRAHKNPNHAEAPPKPQPAGKKKSEDSQGLGKNIAELIQFIKDSYIEFRKISWPTRQQVVKETWSVLVLVTMLTLAVLAFDFGIARVVFEPLDKFAKKVGGGVGGHQEQTWGPLQAEPGAPVNNPNVPGNALPTQQSLPANSQGTSGQPSPVPTNTPAPANNQAPSSGTTNPPAQPQDAK